MIAQAQVKKRSLGLDTGSGAINNRSFDLLKNAIAS